MTDENEPSDYEIGAESPSWLIKAALRGVKPEMLWLGVCQMVNYLYFNEEPEVHTALDLLVQVSVNGSYVPTREHDCAEHTEGNHYMDPTSQFRTEDAPAPNPEPPAVMSEEDIEAETLRFREYINSLSPDPEPEPEDEDDPEDDNVG